MTQTRRGTNVAGIRSPRGSELTAKSWATEAPLRMLMNNLDAEVAEHPEELVVYGGIGRAARNWDCYRAIVDSLTRLDEDQTLLVQSGKPVGVFPTHPEAPRVLIANSNLVGGWANWEHFNELDRAGLMMYGQMTAGSWIYIGSQGIVQGTYETFAEVGRQHFGGDLSGKWILTGGLGGMGGAQPLAATMAGASLIAVECQPSRVEFRLRTRYLDTEAATIDEALAIVERARVDGKPVSVGLLGNAAEIYPEMLARGIRPDAVTDQTSAHDPANGYLPAGWTLEEWAERRERDPAGVAGEAKRSMARQVEAMLAFHREGIPVLDYGNNIRQMASEAGLKDAFDFPGFVQAYVRPLFCRGKGPFRWAALSGDPEDIYRTDEAVKELLPDDRALHTWLDMARERIAFQGLPSQDLLARARRPRPGGSRLQRAGADGRDKRPHRDRPRPHGFGLGREPQPRDRGDARRHRRGRRLGVPQRDAQHRLRRDLGQHPPRRRGRHGLFPARRHGGARRRHRGGRAQARPGAVERPRLRRDAPRRRGLRHRHRDGEDARPRPADAGGVGPPFDTALAPLLRVRGFLPHRHFDRSAEGAERRNLPGAAVRHSA